MYIAAEKGNYEIAKYLFNQPHLLINMKSIQTQNFFSYNFKKNFSYNFNFFIYKIQNYFYFNAITNQILSLSNSKFVIHKVLKSFALIIFLITIVFNSIHHIFFNEIFIVTI